jgi:tetratricopeptide (TPR) repeat protein
VAPGGREPLFNEGASFLDEPAFRAAADLHPELRTALRTISRLVDGHSVDARQLAQAALTVSEWATGRGHAGTAALFAGLAARLRPRDPDLAFAAGRAERRCGRFDQAGEWFVRAIGLSRRSGDDAAYASAFLGWGLMEEERGMRASARQKYVRAWRAAMRGSLHQLGAAARHNMIALSVPDDPFDTGFSHVVAAYKLYDDSSAERLALLALDAGVFFAEHGLYAAALPLYDAADRHLSRPAIITALHANVARAAAALDHVERFRQAAAIVTREESQAGEFAPGALAELSRAAYTMGLDGKAVGYANAAAKAAKARGALTAERAALDALAAVRERRTRDVPIEPPPRVRRFVKRFVARMAALEPARKQLP